MTDETDNKSQKIDVDSRVNGDVTQAGRDVITKIQNNFTVIYGRVEPPPDLEQLRIDYLAYLRESYRNLDIKGIMQVQRVAPQIPLAAVYVPLKARSQHAEARIAGRAIMRGEPIAEMERVTHSAEPVPVEVALKSEPAVIVLGDPGAGKSTLLKVIALALAEQKNGPLPILLPLNAYARRLLQQGEVNLCEFLGEYYATRQDRLRQVGELFKAALRDKQAVVLLDGLDEVQADRAFLVRLVEDFVQEFTPEPAGAELRPPDEDEAVVGNRVVVTSRVVGYDEAPLGDSRWRHYTLTDFDRGDIERFVEQWTLAFEIGVHGDTDTAREAAEGERRELMDAISSRPGVERLAANPLLLTILALIKRTGVVLPEHRVKLYELYLEALIESWNLARSLDKRPIGSPLNYLETVQVLAPLALWLRETNPTAGLVARSQLEEWLTDYYIREWGLPRGEARKEGREFIRGVNRYSNLLVERGERQYGFLHLTLEEMLAANGITQLTDEGIAQAVDLFVQHLADPAWHETLQLTIGAVGVIQRRPATAGKLLLALLDTEVEGGAPRGFNVVFAGEALCDVGEVGVGRQAASRVTAALVSTMQDPECHIRERRDAGLLLGRLGWLPEPDADDMLIAPCEPTGLDAYRRVGDFLIGKYPVTNLQYARFVDAGGYDEPRWWTEEGWAWRTGESDSKITYDWLRDWLKERPPTKRNQPFWGNDRKWNNPLQPVVGVSWFEVLAYCAWLSAQFESYTARLPGEEEWEQAVGGCGEYAWGDSFDPTCINCADSWAGRDLSESDWREWLDSEKQQEASTTVVATFPAGQSAAGIWDGCGNVWEWMGSPYQKGEVWIALRGGSWSYNQMTARVSDRSSTHPDDFDDHVGFRVCVVAQRD